MAKLKLGTIEDDKPIKPHGRIAGQPYIVTSSGMAKFAGRQSGQAAVEPARLIAPMVSHFMADRPRLRQNCARTEIRGAATTFRKIRLRKS